MVRRSTLIVVIIFVLVLAGFITLQRNPSWMPFKPTATPVSTPVAKLITGWQDTDVVEASMKRLVGGTTQLVKNADGTWTNTNPAVSAKPLDAGVVEQLVSELLAVNVMAELPSELTLKDLFLENPTQIITIKAADGRTTTLLIGGNTVTNSGYYVKVDNNRPVLADKNAIDTIMTLFDQAMPVMSTLTPDINAAIPTATP